MMLDVRDADPFVLLVHHRHRFSAWDPVRLIFRLLLPEGFPAHVRAGARYPRLDLTRPPARIPALPQPHRGFETVTMTMHGGLVHRDSLGVKQKYGDGDVQWLTAGRGVLHEEMCDRIPALPLVPLCYHLTSLCLLQVVV